MAKWFSQVLSKAPNEPSYGFGKADTPKLVDRKFKKPLLRHAHDKA